MSLTQVECESCIINCLNLTLGNSISERLDFGLFYGNSTGSESEIVGPELLVNRLKHASTTAAGKFDSRGQHITGLAYGMGVTCHAHYR